MAALAISAGVTGRCGDMLGVWIEPVTAQVMMTLPWAAAMRGLPRRGSGRRRPRRAPAAAARGLDRRHGLARAIEHAVEIDGDAAVPVLDPDVLDLAGGPAAPAVTSTRNPLAEVSMHSLLECRRISG